MLMIEIIFLLILTAEHYEQGIKTLGTGSFITEYLIISTLTGTN